MIRDWTRKQQSAAHSYKWPLRGQMGRETRGVGSHAKWKHKLTSLLIHDNDHPRCYCCRFSSHSQLLRVFRQRTIETEPPLLGHDPAAPLGPTNPRSWWFERRCEASNSLSKHWGKIYHRFYDFTVDESYVSYSVHWVYVKACWKTHCTVHTHLCDICYERRQLPLKYAESPLV